MCPESSVTLDLEGNDEEIKGQNDCGQASHVTGLLVPIQGLFWTCSSWQFNILGKRRLHGTRQNWSSFPISEICDLRHLNVSVP